MPAARSRSPRRSPIPAVKVESEFRIENGQTVGPRRDLRSSSRSAYPAQGTTAPHPTGDETGMQSPAAAAARFPLQPIRIYPFGVSRDRLMQSAKRMGVPALIVKDSGEADVLVTLRSYYRDRQQTVLQAETRGMPVHVLRANTVSQMEQFLSNLFNLSELTPSNGEMELVKNQAQAAIAAVLNGERWVDLPPGPAPARRLQHELARQSELISHSYGKEPRRHVRIFRE